MTESESLEFAHDLISAMEREKIPPFTEKYGLPKMERDRLGRLISAWVFNRVQDEVQKVKQ